MDTAAKSWSCSEKRGEAAPCAWVRDSIKLKKKRETKENNEWQNKQDVRHEEFSKLAAAGRRRLDEKVCVTALQDFWAAAAAVAAAQKRNSCSRVTPA